MWTPVLAAALSSVAAGVCHDNADCLHNGDCVHASCVCDPGWLGETCELLKVGRAPLVGAYGARPNVTSWGGFSTGSINGTYHLYVAEIITPSASNSTCGLTAWQTNSRCVHATATSLGGPYTFSDVAVGVWCHGPQITVDNTSGVPKYLLFHIPNRPNGTAVGCSPAGSPKEDHHQPDRIAPEDHLSQDVGRAAATGGSPLHVSDSPYGPWTPAFPPGLKSSFNPSPVLFANGSILFVGQDWKVQAAPSWRGPWQTRGQVEWHGDGGAGCSRSVSTRRWVCHGWEDPFLWYDGKRRVWKMLAHVWPSWLPDEPACDHDYAARVAGFAWSYDAINWHRSPVPPFSNAVQHVDGSISYLSTRERPKLVLAADHTPLALFSGASANPPPWGCKIKPGVDSTYTLFVPVLR